MMWMSTSCGPPAACRSSSGRAREANLFAAGEPRLGGHLREQLDQPGNDAGPAGLVAGAQARPVVAVEVFVELQVIAPVRVLLELAGPAEHRPPPLPVAQKDAGQASGQFLGDLVKVHLPPR